MTKTNEDLIKMDDILKQAEKYDGIETATIGDGEFTVQFYPHFASDKIDNVLVELGAFLNSKDKDSESFIELINSSEENVMMLTYFFIVKEFTHIGEDMKDKNTPAELFPYFEALIKTGYLTELIENVFLAEEIQKVIMRMSDRAALSEHVNQFGIQFFESLSEHEETLKRLNQYSK